ncbi:MAG: hypothetical protein JEZ12_03325 [Desulfobacterium sp.]|nr:hypothetical protein [Desulfobacterium sp.]
MELTPLLIPLKGSDHVQNKGTDWGAWAIELPSAWRKRFGSTLLGSDDRIPPITINQDFNIGSVEAVTNDRKIAATIIAQKKERSGRITAKKRKPIAEAKEKEKKAYFTRKHVDGGPVVLPATTGAFENDSKLLFFLPMGSMVVFFYIFEYDFLGMSLEKHIFV